MAPVNMQKVHHHAQVRQNAANQEIKQPVSPKVKTDDQIHRDDKQIWTACEESKYGDKIKATEAQTGDDFVEACKALDSGFKPNADAKTGKQTGNHICTA